MNRPDVHAVHTVASWSTRHSGLRRVRTGYRPRVGPWPGRVRTALSLQGAWARADATASGGHGPDTQDGGIVDVELVVSHAYSTGMAIAMQSDEHDGGSPHRPHDPIAVAVSGTTTV